MEKIVKARKEHICQCCEKIISKGDFCLYGEGRMPKYEDDYGNDQIGIQYYKFYLCKECSEIEI